MSRQDSKPLVALPLALCCLALAAALVVEVRAARPGPLSAPGPWFGAPQDLALVGAWALAALGAATSLRAARGVPVALLWAALALRGVTLALPPVLSDDLFRYLWEGRVLLAGHNPFELAPDHPALAYLRDGHWAQVNHKQVSTVYPPGALALFAAVAGSWPSPTAWRVLAAGCDLGVLATLLALCRARGLGAFGPTLYALHPLPVLESAGSAHLEAPALLALALALLAAERGRWGLAALGAGMGAGIKLLPGVLLVPLLRRGGRRAAAGALVAGLALAALALPLLDAGPSLGRGFSRYYEAWAFNGALFPLLERVAGDPQRGRAVGVALGALWCARAAWRRRDPAWFSLDVAAALLLLSPVVHPWYVLWALVPALAVGAWPWAVLASTTLLSYVVLGGYDRVTGQGWEEPAWLNEVVYGPLLLALAAEQLRRWRASRPEAPGSSSPSPT